MVWFGRLAALSGLLAGLAPRCRLQSYTQQAPALWPATAEGLSLPARFAVVFYEACNRGEASLAFNLSSERGCSSVVDTAVTGGNSHWCDPLLAVKEVLHVQSGKLASWNFLPPPQEAGLFLLASQHGLSVT